VEFKFVASSALLEFAKSLPDSYCILPASCTAPTLEFVQSLVESKNQVAVMALTQSQNLSALAIGFADPHSPDKFELDLIAINGENRSSQVLNLIFREMIGFAARHRFTSITLKTLADNMPVISEAISQLGFKVVAFNSKGEGHPGEVCLERHLDLYDLSGRARPVLRLAASNEQQLPIPVLSRFNHLVSFLQHEQVINYSLQGDKPSYMRGLSWLLKSPPDVSYLYFHGDEPIAYLAGQNQGDENCGTILALECAGVKPNVTPPWLNPSVLHQTVNNLKKVGYRGVQFKSKGNNTNLIFVALRCGFIIAGYEPLGTAGEVLLEKVFR